MALDRGKLGDLAFPSSDIAFYGCGDRPILTNIHDQSFEIEQLL
ncbi:MAG: hypothetical protein SFY66_14160 [Oculatellaceae cyanobacterium bins.114]|nr:hypothetical protein [Oculatellaceae cyanobacterium bins.114]